MLVRSKSAILIILVVSLAASPALTQDSQDYLIPAASKVPAKETPLGQRCGAVIIEHAASYGLHLMRAGNIEQIIKLDNDTSMPYLVSGSNIDQLVIADAHPSMLGFTVIENIIEKAPRIRKVLSTDRNKWFAHVVVPASKSLLAGGVDDKGEAVLTEIPLTTDTPAHQVTVKLSTPGASVMDAYAIDDQSKLAILTLRNIGGTNHFLLVGLDPLKEISCIPVKGF